MRSLLWIKFEIKLPSRIISCHLARCCTHCNTELDNFEFVYVIPENAVFKNIRILLGTWVANPGKLGILKLTDFSHSYHRNVWIILNGSH